MILCTIKFPITSPIPLPAMAPFVTSTTRFPFDTNCPEVNNKLPAIVCLESKETPLKLFTVTFPKIVLESPEISCRPDPINSTVLVGVFSLNIP